MIYPVYCIRDRKGEYGEPRINMNDGTAQRWFAMLVNNPDPNFSVSFAPILTHTASCAIPPLPGRAKISSTDLFFFIALMIACSLPPPPITIIFIKNLLCLCRGFYLKTQECPL